MILQIGNPQRIPEQREHRINTFSSQRGFTLVECLMAVAILALGIVFIYKALLRTLDVEDYLNHRLYAEEILQSQADLLSLISSQKAEIPADLLTKVFATRINNRPVNFVFDSEILEFKKLRSLLQLSLTVKWPERGRHVQILRKIYVERLPPKELWPKDSLHE